MWHTAYRSISPFPFDRPRRCGNSCSVFRGIFFHKISISIRENGSASPCGEAYLIPGAILGKTRGKKYERKRKTRYVSFMILKAIWASSTKNSRAVNPSTRLCVLTSNTRLLPAFRFWRTVCRAGGGGGIVRLQYAGSAQSFPGRSRGVRSELTVSVVLFWNRINGERKPSENTGVTRITRRVFSNVRKRRRTGSGTWRDKPIWSSPTGAPTKIYGFIETRSRAGNTRRLS